MIVVQRISTTWSKKSRGMPGAAKRNTIPRRLTIPFYTSDIDGIYAHEVNSFERSNFNLEQSTKFFENKRRYWSLDFVEDRNNEIIEVFFAYSISEHGKPNRGTYRRPLFKLSPGEWGAFHINGRFISYSGQWYCQYFVNIANTKNVQPNMFLESGEKYFVDKTVHLF